MTAILFGSISTIADTSELQRAAFNQAFVEHDLEWSWDREDYRSMLSGSGGEQRIAEYARSLGQEVDAASVHQSKSRAFQRSLSEGGVVTRDGVVATIHDARAAGHRVALVTTTSAENIAALAAAVAGELDFDEAFDLIVDGTQVERPKPDAAAYVHALHTLDEQPGQCVAVEDNPAGLVSATTAGVRTVVFPNVNTADLRFAEADARTWRLTLDGLHDLLDR